jgi:Leucine-rich repeat (LRR) protein
LVGISRSFLGSIKHCYVTPFVHQYAINQSRKEGFLIVNPDGRTIESVFRIAIHPDNNNCYREFENDHIHSFLAFNFPEGVLRYAMFLRVLELKGSAVPSASLPQMTNIRYLGLRDTNIRSLPDNIGAMQNLQTLDIRNTGITSLPESLWNISTIRNVYVLPISRIKGPPATANLKDLQILKSVVVPESWLEKLPQFLICIKKLALSNPDHLDWKSVSSLLSKTVRLVSLAITGDSIPTEFVDTRAFPNLESVESIMLEGKWYRTNLYLDNVKFPTNLMKLILIKSGLKEDPMPRIEKLETLKYLSLQDGAFTGKRMICSAEGFSQLQVLKLGKLEHLEELVVEANAMQNLSTLSIAECTKLNKLPDLQHVTIKMEQ